MAPFLNSIGFALTALIASPAISFSSSSTFSPSVKLYTDTARAKKLLHEDTWTSGMSPAAARQYLTTRSTWLDVTPDCENGSIADEVDKEFPMHGQLQAEMVRISYVGIQFNVIAMKR